MIFNIPFSSCSDAARSKVSRWSEIIHSVLVLYGNLITESYQSPLKIQSFFVCFVIEFVLKIGKVFTLTCVKFVIKYKNRWKPMMNLTDFSSHFS